MISPEEVSSRMTILGSSGWWDGLCHYGRHYLRLHLRLSSSGSPLALGAVVYLGPGSEPSGLNKNGA